MYNLASYLLKGPVHSIKESTYKAVFRDGRILKGAKTRDSIDTEDVFYHFNEDGNLTEIVYYDLEGAEVKKESLTYNKNGVVQELLNIHKHGVEYRTVYLSDENGKIIGQKNYYKRDFFLDVYIDVFDKKGNYIGHESYDEDGNITGSCVYILNEKGAEIEFLHYGSSGRLLSRAFSYYDDNGKLFERVSYNNCQIHKIIYRFDSQKNPTEEIVYKSKNTIEEHRKYQYSFDALGNWVKKVIYKNGIPVKIVEREIKHYQSTDI